MNQLCATCGLVHAGEPRSGGRAIRPGPSQALDAASAGGGTVSCEATNEKLTRLPAPQVSTNLVNLPGSSEIVYEPYGVILSLSPWNYPYSLALEPVIGAIAAGNAVVLKPSETAPATAALLKALVEAYLDPQAVRVVLGGVEESTALLEQRWDKIMFTGRLPPPLPR